AEARHVPQRRVGDEYLADEGISLEEGVALPEQGVHLLAIERLQIATNIHHDVAVGHVPQRFDVGARAEVVLNAVALSRSGITGVRQDDRLQALLEVGPMSCQRSDQRALSDARRSRQDHQSSSAHAALQRSRRRLTKVYGGVTPLLLAPCAPVA